MILETDPERGGKADYAFDNPGFKGLFLLQAFERLKLTILVADATLIVTKPDSTTKPSIWAPIFSLKTEKKRPQDDSALQVQTLFYSRVQKPLYRYRKLKIIYRVIKIRSSR